MKKNDPSLEFVAHTITLLARKILDRSTNLERPWCVLALGAPLHPNDFHQREAARETLRSLLEQRSISLREFIWVWDWTNRAQVLIAQFFTRDAANEFAQILSKKGIAIRVDHMDNLPLVP